MKCQFNEKVKDWDVHGVRILGEVGSGMIIGLDEATSKELDQFLSDDVGDERNEMQENLYQAFSQNGYFEQASYNLDSAYVHVTSACNLHCVGCYSYECERNKQEQLSTAQICSILDNLKVSGARALTFSGGEPFLRCDIEEILKYAKETLQFTVVVATNGTLPLECYKKCLPYLDLLSVSIDGYKDDVIYLRDPDIMPKITRNLEALKGLTNLSMIVTLHKKNLHEISNYIALSSRLQVPFSLSLFTVPTDDPVFKDYILTDEDFVALEKLSDHYDSLSIMDSAIDGDLGCKEACGAGKTMASIAANGDIYPCHMLQMEEFKMGNALTDSISEALLKGKLYDFSVDSIDECNGCEYKYLCGGGCRFRSYAYFNGDMNRIDKCCSLYKKVLSKNLDKLLNQK